MSANLIASCGDALVDFVPARSADGRDAFVPTVGGSCLNVAVAMARLGAAVTFIGGVSTDLFGDMIIEHMRLAGIDQSRLARSELETTLAFVKMHGADARYAFYDDNSAGRQWNVTPESLLLSHITALHVGSVTLINEPSASSYERLVGAARAGSVVSFDPNCRPSLVRNPAEYRARMLRIAAMSDIIRMSSEDFSHLFPGGEETAICAGLLASGARVVLLTRGADGATAFLPDQRLDIASQAVSIVDTIGAGDTFQGAFLVALERSGLLRRQHFATLSATHITKALAFAARAAAVTCGRRGCDPPSAADLDQADLGHTDRAA